MSRAATSSTDTPSAFGLRRTPEPNAGEDVLRRALSDAIDEGRRADCMARIQSDAVALALDLMVRETGIDGFFREFIRTLVDETESRACGVWLLASDESRCEKWLTYRDGHFGQTHEADHGEAAREEMADYLVHNRAGWTDTQDFDGDDARLPETLRAMNRETGIRSLQIAPLALGPRTLGWIALGSATTSACEVTWRRAVLEATAQQATLALQQSRLAEASRLEARRQGALEERNRIARDIHDTLTQGFAAILMQLQGAQRSPEPLPPAVANAIDVAVDVARTHMIEARRSVGALRPQAAGDETLPAALERMTAFARRTSDVPIELAIDDIPPLGGLERDIIGVAQEALNNAVRHSCARKISIRASTVRSIGFRLSVADNGRGIAGDLRSRGFGMTSMHERAERIGASLTIVTAPRAGTEVVLAWEPPSFSIPVMPDAAR
jgi:signal transduction histidine kinase